MNIVLRARWVNTALIVLGVYVAAGYAFGPPRLTSSGSYQVALSWLPAHWWGWLMLAGALASIAAPLLHAWGSIAVHAVAALPLFAFAAALGVAQVRGESQGWGGIALFLLLGAGHLVLVHARLRSPETADA